MKTCLHLHSDNSEQSVFYHLIDDILLVNQGDIVDYGQKYFHLLGIRAKEEFERFGLSKEKYKVLSTHLEVSGTENEIYVFLKPI